jgi:hypothetical protein
MEFEAIIPHLPQRPCQKSGMALTSATLYSPRNLSSHQSNLIQQTTKANPTFIPPCIVVVSERMNDHKFRAGTFVCASCLEDEALQRFANEHGDTRQCDYCGNTPTSLSVVPLDNVTEFMARAIAEEWCDPVQTAPYCSAEGGYQVETLENHELFERIGFEVSNDRLMDDLLEAFADHDWCEVNWQILSPSKRWSAAWRRFERVIKHERRYTFWYGDDDDESPAHPDHLPPSQMLNELQAVINNSGLVNQLPVSTSMWRVRCHDHGAVLADAHHFTSPPVEFAIQPNRMSPAGVPMFYGAADFETALEEVVDLNDLGRNRVASGGQFVNCLPLNVLDLTAIPARPSYFAPDGPFNRHIIQFLKTFAEIVSQPIRRDGRPHIEYVPTQVFTEFVRHVMKGPQGVPIHGIKFASSRSGRACYVIFAAAANCLPIAPHATGPQFLEFVPGSVKTISIP